jgi:hypothetical protein
MTVVNTKEFNNNPEKYFDMALDEQVFVKRGDYMFHILCSNIDDAVKEQAILEPDDDLRNAITAKELIKRISEDKRRNFVAHI